MHDFKQTNKQSIRFISCGLISEPECRLLNTEIMGRIKVECPITTNLSHIHVPGGQKRKVIFFPCRKLVFPRYVYFFKKILGIQKLLQFLKVKSSPSPIHDM
jgi:hypothetical protein